MRIIFLNSWFGKAGESYLDFIKSEFSKTDIFGLMEVTPDLFSKLSKILKDFNFIYDKGSYLKEIDTFCGQAIFLKKGIEIVENRNVSIYRQLYNDRGVLQFVKMTLNGKELFLGSVHGKTRPGDKLDTQIRLEQSKKIIDFFVDEKGPKIIGGDFNLNPDTKSIKMFEESGYKNLIKDFKIKSTRNKLSWEQFASQPGFTKQYFADYCFVSPEVKVKNFEVPKVEVSDHLPLVLDFEL